MVLARGKNSLLNLIEQKIGTIILIFQKIESKIIFLCKTVTWFFCLILRTILHPFILSLLQLKNIWNGKEEQKQEIRTYQLIRGCAESPILFIIQVWLITYGLLPWTNTSEILVKDWEGNVLSLTYLRPVSIAFSFSTILRHSEHISLFLTNIFTILFD